LLSQILIKVFKGRNVFLAGVFFVGFVNIPDAVVNDGLCNWVKSIAIVQRDFQQGNNKIRLKGDRVSFFVTAVVFVDFKRIEISRGTV